MVYNQILRFVERDLVRIMVLAEGVSATHNDVDPDHIDTDKDTDGNRFHILSNVIWQEIAHAVTTDLGTIVFASGHPNEFHKVRILFLYP
jgi:conserved oligomeric Golgi complex subunit 2